VARLSFPTEGKVPPPVLIDASQLEALDRLLDEHTHKLRLEREQRISELVNTEINERVVQGILKEDRIENETPRIRESVARLHSLEREIRSVTIYLPQGKEVEGNRFADATSHPLGEKETPLGFLLLLKVGEVKARVSVAGPWREGLYIDVEPNDAEIAQELYGALRNWASDVEPPKWQQIWCVLRSLFGWLLYLWIAMGLVFIPLSNRGEAGKNVQKAEARKLLANGINPGSQQRALELLLAIESDYDPGIPTLSLGRRYWGYFALGAMVLGAACICPQISIGILNGKQRVRRWRLWIKTVTVTVPALVVTSILLPWLLYWLGLYPPSR